MLSIGITSNAFNKFPSQTPQKIAIASNPLRPLVFIGIAWNLSLISIHVNVKVLLKYIQPKKKKNTFTPSNKITLKIYHT